MLGATPDSEGRPLRMNREPGEDPLAWASVPE
jgi:hypothetical protein